MVLRDKSGTGEVKIWNQPEVQQSTEGEEVEISNIEVTEWTNTNTKQTYKNLETLPHSTVKVPIQNECTVIQGNFGRFAQHEIFYIVGPMAFFMHSAYKTITMHTIQVNRNWQERDLKFISSFNLSIEVC